MKNELVNSQNSRLEKVREEIGNFLSIITGVILEEAQNEQNLAYFEQTATSKEDSKTIQELKESLENLDKKAKNYRNSIGIINSNKQQPSKTQNNKNTNNTYTTDKTQTTVNKSINIEQNNFKHNDDYDIEI